MERPNVYAGAKEQTMKGFSNIPTNANSRQADRSEDLERCPAGAARRSFFATPAYTLAWHTKRFIARALSCDGRTHIPLENMRSPNYGQKGSHRS